MQQMIRHKILRKKDRTVRTAILLAMTGLLLTGNFFLSGDAPRSAAITVFIGLPALITGVFIYLMTMFRNLNSSN